MNTGAIIGGVIGGVAIITICVVIIYKLWKAKQGAIIMESHNAKAE